MKDKDKTIEIHSDGSCFKNPGTGAFCTVMIYKDKRKEITEKFKLTTNNRMELMSVVVALESLKVSDWNVNIYSDSKYVVDSIDKGWVFNWNKKSNFDNKKNRDLWERFLQCYPQNKVKMIWVKGHDSNEMNNYCDMMAVQKNKDNTPYQIDYGYTDN